MSSSNQKVIILIGPPGSGKGTQSDIISRTLKIPNFSVGDALRRKMREGNDDEIKSMMKSGKLLPEIVVNQIVNEFIVSNIDTDYILDGYPRNLKQAQFLETVLGNITPLVLFFDIDFKVLKDRILGRLLCNSCDMIYHSHHNKPMRDGICDDCGSKLFTRLDDDENILISRIKEYHNQTGPLIKYYQDNSRFLRVDASCSQADVTDQVISFVKMV